MKTGRKFNETSAESRERFEAARRLNPAGDYREWLAAFHKARAPRNYLEIGVHEGKTLRLVDSKCRVIGVDPTPCIRYSLPGLTTLYAKTSDEFFKQNDLEKILGEPVDLAFIDGLHESYQVARDVMNVLQYCDEDSLVLLHDMVPVDEKSSRPDRETGFWSGDCYKALPFLCKAVPGLNLRVIRAYPSGLIVLQHGGAINPEELKGMSVDDGVKAYENLTVAQFHEEWLASLENIMEEPRDKVEAINQLLGES